MGAYTQGANNLFYIRHHSNNLFFIRLSSIPLYIHSKLSLQRDKNGTCTEVQLYVTNNCFTVKRADSVEGSTNSINKSMAKIKYDSMIYFCVMMRKGFYSKNMKIHCV